MVDRRTFLARGAKAGAGVMAAGLQLPARAVQGVTKNEIVIGSIQDLSGPVVALGKPIYNGMILHVEQTNASGGINGRKVRLIVEDSGYDPKKAVLAAQKLLTRDQIFAMVGTLGTPVSLATLPLCLEKGVPHLFPITSHTGNFEPFHKLKFSMSNPYPNTTRIAVTHMIRRGGYKRVGIMYQDDEMGLDILRGAEIALKDAGMPLVEKTSYKRGATEFSSQMQKLVAANADLIVLGTVVRETIGGIVAARQLGFAGDFIGCEAAYQIQVAKAGGKAVEGFYAVSTMAMPYREDPANPKALNEWMDAYQARFNEEADLVAAYGRLVLDPGFKALDAAGPDPPADTMVAALESRPYPRSFLGNAELAWSPTKRMGQDQARIARIQNGRWVPVSDFMR